MGENHRSASALSVVLCTCNAGEFLEPQLNSIARQTRAPDELVIFDDRSTDETRSRLRAFCDRAPFPVRLFLNEARLGSTKNFEHGLGKASGEIIALADQDDVWAPHKLARIAATFAARPGLGLVFTDADLVDARGDPLGSRLWERVGFDAREQRRVESGQPGVALEVLVRQNVVTGATLALRGRLLEWVLPIPGIWVHDHWIALVGSALSPIAFIHEPLIQYRQHGANQIGAQRATLRSELRKVFADRSAEYGVEAEQFELALERVTMLGAQAAGTAGAVAELQRKVEHMKIRAGMPPGRLNRLPRVAAEVRSRGYFRYSNGLRSMAQDLLHRAENAFG